VLLDRLNPEPARQICVLHVALLNARWWDVGRAFISLRAAIDDHWADADPPPPGQRLAGQTPEKSPPLFAGVCPRHDIHAPDLPDLARPLRTQNGAPNAQGSTSIRRPNEAHHAPRDVVSRRFPHQVFVQGDLGDAQQRW